MYRGRPSHNAALRAVLFDQEGAPHEMRQTILNINTGIEQGVSALGTQACSFLPNF